MIEPTSLWPEARFCTLPSPVLIGETIFLENLIGVSLSRVVEFFVIWLSCLRPLYRAASSSAFVDTFLALLWPILRVLLW